MKFFMEITLLKLIVKLYWNRIDFKTLHSLITLQSKKEILCLR